MKKIIYLLIILSAINLFAQEKRNLELAVGSKFLAPISDGWDGDYFVGASVGLGFVLSPQVILGGTIAYLTYINNDESTENWESLPGIIINIKRVFSLKDSTINPYLQLEAGLFIPIDDYHVYIFPEVCGTVGMEILLNTKTSLFIDIGYMLGITAEEIPKLISANLGVNFKI
jgi:hypothetical protein